MNIVKKLSLASVFGAFITLEALAATPAHAAFLNFSFTTESGGTGTFTLDNGHVSRS